MSRGRRSPSLVGRREEFAVIGRCLSRAAAGQGQCVFIEGEAGIGKTRLVEELIGEAEARGFDARRGAAEELDAAPFAALSAALGRQGGVAALLGESGEAGGRVETGGSHGARYRVVEAMGTWVEELAESRPLALVVEDLHWADPSTVVALRWLMRRSRSLPVLLVGTLRPAPSGPELGALLEAAAVDEAPMLLSLGPLGPDAVEALVTEMVGVPPGSSVGNHLGRAGGNPFFVIEMVDALIEEDALELRQGRAEALGFELAPGRRLTLLRRLRTLPRPTHEALRMAAVLGTSFGVTQLAEVLGRSPLELAAALEEAVAAKVVCEAGDRLAFRHELLREAIYTDTAWPIRVGLHLHAGRVLARTGAPALQVAEHLALGAASGDRQAVHWLHEAACQVVSTNPGVAAEFLGKALALVEGADPARQAITADLVTALNLSGRYADAEGLARQALGSPCEVAVASVLRLSLLRTLVASGRGAEACREVAAVEADFSSPAGIQFQVEAAWARLLAGDVEGGRVIAETARTGAEHNANDAGVCGALVVLGFISVMRGEVAEALAMLDEAVARAEAVDTAEVHRTAPSAFFALALVYADRMHEARAQLERGRCRIEQGEVACNLPLFQLMSLVVGFFAGTWDDSVAEAQAGFDLAGDTGNHQGTVIAWSLLSVRAVYANDFSGAAEALANGEAELAAGRTQIHSHCLGWARAIYEEAVGHDDVALNELSNTWSLCSVVGLACDQPLFGPDLVRMHLAAGQREEARSIVQSVEATAARMGSAPARAASLRCRGLIDDDTGALLSAVTEARIGSTPLALGGACMDAGAALGKAGRTPEAVALFEEALAVWDRLGAARETARAKGALRALGVRRRRRPTAATMHGGHRLTNAEAAVVALVGEGLTNHQVAERLFVSPRTVETHVAHVFAKLGLSSRTQLILLSARGDSSGPARPVPTGAPTDLATR